MHRSLVYLILQICLLTTTSGILNNCEVSIEWVNVPSSQLLAYVEPAGWEEGYINLFLCRTQYKDRWVPGKIWVGPFYQHRVLCFISDEDVDQHYSEDFQVLRAHPGTVSWVPSEGRNLPPNAIAGGTHWTGETTYVCRGRFDDGASLIVGRYSYDEGLCYFTANGKQWTQGVFEILTINAYGLAINVKYDPNQEFFPTLSATSIPRTSDISLYDPNSVNHVNNAIQWLNATPSEVMVHGLNPAGWEDHLHLFVCRAWIPEEERWLPGKIWVNAGFHHRVLCFVSKNQNETIPKVDFQLLLAPSGTTSWVPGSVNYEPEHGIIGGTGVEGENLFVCRAFPINNSTLIIGKYSTNTKLCYVTVADNAHFEISSFEILVANDLAMTKGVSAPIHDH